MTIVDPENTNHAGAGSSLLQEVMSVVTSADVAIHDLVAFTMATDGVLRCAPADTDVHDPAVRVGVALEAATSGRVCRVVVRGPAIVNTPATGPSVSELLILTNAAGVGDGLAADATAVVGDTHGVFLTDEIGTSNTSWVWVD